MKRPSLALMFVIFLLGILMSTSAQATIRIDIYRETDRLTIYVGGNQPVNLDGLGFQITLNGAPQSQRYLKDYPVFKGVNLTNLPTPACFVIRSLQANAPLPTDCQNITLTTSIYTQSIQVPEIFWYDAVNFQPRLFTLFNGSQALSQQCPDIGLCAIDYPVSVIVPPTITPTIPVASGCIMTDSMNLLTSPDTDEDGYSDFEELCILKTSSTVPNQDIDQDGIPDEIEAVIASVDPTWADSTIRDEDRDGDWLPDKAELSLNLFPDEPDSDKDMISDFIEFYWLGSDPKLAATDANGNRFPDVLEPYLFGIIPTRCQMKVTLRIDQLWIAIPEEADSFDIVEGDESSLTYELATSSDPNNNNFRQRWSGDGLQQDDRIRNFNQIPTRTVLCGDTVLVRMSAQETDAPFGGVADLGIIELRVPLIFQRVPIGIQWAQAHDPVIFSGIVEDGDYDYRIYYTLDIQPAR